MRQLYFLQRYVTFYLEADYSCPYFELFVSIDINRHHVEHVINIERSRMLYYRRKGYSHIFGLPGFVGKDVFYG